MVDCVSGFSSELLVGKERSVLDSELVGHSCADCSVISEGKVVV
jgi:hypothetical protein